MKSNRNNHLCTAIKVAGFAIAASSAVAADLTWDTVPGDGAIITAGSGTWDTSATAWNDAGTDVVWSQTSPTSGSNAAIFAGTDGTVNQYVITLGEAVAAQSITFNSSGYQITGGTLALMNGALNGSIAVAAGKTATIDSTLRYNHNVAASLTVGTDGVLNLGGGTTTNFDPQLSMSGAGTVNLTAGNFRSNIANVNVAAVNLIGGTYRYSPGNNNGATIGNNAGRNVSYTVSGTGTLTVNNNAGSGTGSNISFLRVGNATTPAFEAKLTVQTGGTMTVGSGKYGELQIAGSADSNGKFDVQGGTVTIAAGVPTANQIYIFKAGANSGCTATMTQSDGTVTANGIQFGGATGTYDAASSAILTLGGGWLYVGAQGITRGSAAGDLPVTIRLQGGTLAADQNWSSSLNMQLGATGGGPIIRAQNSGGTGRNIALAGNLSNDGEVDGTLTKTGGGDLTLSGTNTYSGGTTIDAGRLFIAGADALPATGAVQVNGGRLGFNAGGSPTYNQSIIIANGGTLFMRQEATLTDVTLPTEGKVNFNRDNATTSGFTLNGNTVLTGDLTVEVGGGSTPATEPVTLEGDISGDFGLTKAQQGTLVLSGANSYSGDTTVSAGTLSLGQVNASNESSAVTIAETGATLDLTFAGTDTVDRLFIGTTQMAAGEYGAVGSVSPATGIAQITGTGTLTVTSGPVGFAAWITGNFANGAVPSGKQGPNDDFDNDGIPNLVEYAIAGEDPTVPNPGIGSFNGALLSFSKRMDATGLTYAIEESTDLGMADGWDEVGSYTENTASTISYTLTPGTPPKNFLRLRVSQ